MIIGKMPWLAHLEDFRKEFQQKGLSQGRYLAVVEQDPLWSCLMNFTHSTLIISFLFVKCKITGTEQHCE